MRNRKLFAVTLKGLLIVLLVVNVFFVENTFATQASANEGIDKVYGQTEFYKYIYDRMLQRQTEIVVKYVGEDYLELFEKFENEEFLEEISEIDDPFTSDDGDYLGSNLSYMKTGIKYSKKTEATFTIQITWRESLEETQYVNQATQILINELKLSDMNAYEKVKVVHDFIVDNVEYDTTLANENAFKALSENSSTCQGYSLLFYKIMTELDVPCRYVTGQGISEDESGPHGWNIVKIGDYWYNIDVTWDDPIYITKSSKPVKVEKSYEFFLKGTTEVFEESHIRDTKFLTPEFMEEHPMASSDFDLSGYSGVDVILEKNPLVWDLSSDEDAKRYTYKEVVLSDVTTYVNIIPNIVNGFDEAISENGIIAIILELWNNSTVSSKMFFFLFIACFWLNVTFDSVKREPVMVVNNQY